MQLPLDMVNNGGRDQLIMIIWLTWCEEGREMVDEHGMKRKD